MQKNSVKPLQIGATISDSWRLMKGQKRYIWLMLVPLLVLLILGWVSVSRALLTFLLMGGPSLSLDWGRMIALGILAAVVVSFIGAAMVIASCNFAQKQEFSKQWFRRAIDRIPYQFCALLILLVIGAVLGRIPGGVLITIFLFPVALTYFVLVGYRLGPIAAVKPAFLLLKGNYWRVLAVLLLSMLLSGLLAITVIGLIWGVPFRVMVMGVIYRDVLAPQLSKEHE